MSELFNECSSLISLPDISKWNISNVTDLSSIFYNCNSLISIPDISKWNFSDVIIGINNIFLECISSLLLPDISNKNKSNDNKAIVPDQIKKLEFLVKNL